MHRGAELFAHLADGRAEPARAAIRYRMIKVQVARLHQHVEQLLFRDGVADLHGAAADLLRVGG